MPTKIEIKHRVTGSVLFELEDENNTVYKTLKKALKSGANLSRADLRGVDLRGVNLSRVDLRGVNLRGVNLYGADLSRANLRGANLYGANLYGANLRGVDLRGANLYGVNLYGANLYGAENADLPKAQTIIVPEGSIIGWKKCLNGLIVKLSIPEEARRSNATGRKCRAEFADVLEIIDTTDKRKKPTVATSQHDDKFIYKLGERVTPNKWNEARFEECAEGIHFYITRIEAENHN